MRVDRDQQHRLVDSHGRRQWQWQRHRFVQRGSQYVRPGPRGIADNWRRHVDCQPGWRDVLLHGLAHGTVDVGGGRRPGDNRNGRRRLFLDILETAAWVVATNSSGSGSGSAAFTVAANMTSSSRSAALSIAGRIITVTQAANTCSYTLSPGSRSIGAEGGTGTITVNTGSGCPWAVTNMPAWISVSGSGPSSGSVTYTVPAEHDGDQSIGVAVGWTADVRRQPGGDCPRRLRRRRCRAGCESWLVGCSRGSRRYIRSG